MNLALNISEQEAWKADFARVLKANPKLTGREEDFKAYCYKPAHKNVPIDVLVKSFLLISVNSR
jgi:beta-xylosidase